MSKIKTEYVEAERMIRVVLDDYKQLECLFGDINDKSDQYTGAIQKIYNNKDGQAIGYDVYVY
jgi:hypothetical protein